MGWATRLLYRSQVNGKIQPEDMFTMLLTMQQFYSKKGLKEIFNYSLIVTISHFALKQLPSTVTKRISSFFVDV